MLIQFFFLSLRYSSSLIEEGLYSVQNILMPLFSLKSLYHILTPNSELLRNQITRKV
jgi:hypothetical protein